MNTEDYKIKELGKGLDTLNNQMTLLTQITTVLMLSNIYIFGYSIDKEDFHYLFVGAIIPLIILFVRYKSFKLIAPIMYSVISLEKSFTSNIPLIGITYGKLIEPYLYKEIIKIHDTEDEDKKILKLNKISSFYNLVFGLGARDVSILLIMFSLIQILTPLLKYYCLTQ